jgi:hypothetical protein
MKLTCGSELAGRNKGRSDAVLKKFCTQEGRKEGIQRGNCVVCFKTLSKHLQVSDKKLSKLMATEVDSLLKIHWTIYDGQKEE